MSDLERTRTGACLCGKITYTVKRLRPIWYCHCEQCRRATGHHMAASQVDLSDIEIRGEPKWFNWNEKSRHAFCPDCGSLLFWRNLNNEYLSVTGGTLDDSTDLPNRGHIFVSEKGGYYDIPPAEAQCLTYTDGVAE